MLSNDWPICCITAMLDYKTARIISVAPPIESNERIEINLACRINSSLAPLPLAIYMLLLENKEQIKPGKKMAVFIHLYSRHHRGQDLRSIF